MRWHLSTPWATPAADSLATREHRLGYWLLVWVLAMLAALVFGPLLSR